MVQQQNLIRRYIFVFLWHRYFNKSDQQVVIHKMGQSLITTRKLIIFHLLAEPCFTLHTSQICVRHRLSQHSKDYFFIQSFWIIFGTCIFVLRLVKYFGPTFISEYWSQWHNLYWPNFSVKVTIWKMEFR